MTATRDCLRIERKGACPTFGRPNVRPVENTYNLDMKLMFIPLGEFPMGSTAPIEWAQAVVDPNNKHRQECIKSEANQYEAVVTQSIYLV